MIRKFYCWVNTGKTKPNFLRVISEKNTCSFLIVVYRKLQE